MINSAPAVTPIRTDCLLCGATRLRKRSILYRIDPPSRVFDNSNFLECGECGLIQVNKDLDDDELQIYYEDEYNRHKQYNLNLDIFPRDYLWGVSRGRGFVKLLKTHGTSTADKNLQVLDVGCGLGHTLYAFREVSASAQLTGIDYDPTAEEILARFNAKFLLTGLTDEVVAKIGPSVNVLMSSHVLEHVRSPVEFLSRCRKLLAPGGRFVCEVPHATPYHLRRGGAHAPHLSFFSKSTLRRALEESGFAVEFLDTVGRPTFWFEREDTNFRTLLRRIGRRTNKADLRKRRAKQTCELNDIRDIGFFHDEYGGPNRMNLRALCKLL